MIRNLMALCLLLILSACAGRYMSGECDDNDMTRCWLGGRCGDTAP
jgi:hypothetical protein